MEWWGRCAVGGALRRCHLNEITVRFYRNKMSKLRLFYVLNFVSNGQYSMFSLASSSILSVFVQLKRLATLRIYRVVHNIKIYGHALAFGSSIGHHNFMATLPMFLRFAGVGARDKSPPHGWVQILMGFCNRTADFRFLKS